MYAHQVIEELNFIQNLLVNRTDLPKETIIYRKTIPIVCETIKRAHKFHIESAEDMYKVFRNRFGKRVMLEDTQHIRLPYKLCWIDYARHGASEVGKTLVSKRGMLVVELKKDLIAVYILNYVDSIKKWVLGTNSYIVSIGINLHERPDFNQLKETVLSTITDRFMGNILPKPMLQLGRHEQREIVLDDSGDMSMVENFLRLVSCKNIIPKKVVAPDKLNKKRKKSGKIEIFKYHVLRIKPSAKTNIGIKDGDGENNRIHFCRGHFKEYTTENPLFGQHTGLYWWQPHVRGDKKKGVVMKDYKIAA